MTFGRHFGFWQCLLCFSAKEKEVEWDEYTWTVEVKPGIEDKKVGWPFAIHVKADSDSIESKVDVMEMGSTKKVWCIFFG